MDLKSAVEERVNFDRFDLKAPSWKKVVRAIDYARFAPSVGGIFAARFIVVQDEKTIGRLADAAQQSFIAKAKCCVVVVSDDDGLVRSYGEKGDLYGRRHVGAVVENFLLGLEEQKLVTSWIWYFADEVVRDILRIPGSVKVEGIFPIGVKPRSGSVKARRVETLDKILYFGEYGNKKMVGMVKHSRDAV